MNNQKDNKRYIFIGNRYYVYQKMKELNLNIIKVFSVKNSYLSNYLESEGIPFTELSSKKSLVNELIGLDYDVIVSNGCPYILPITQLKDVLLKKGINGDYINVHTSLLPDCKGRHPVNAAILFCRQHGVTCHRMDDGIDTGGIIEQVEIPITDDMSLNLIYKLSFMAEGDAFLQAYKNSFMEKESIVSGVTPIYYSRSDEDMYISYLDDYQTIEKKVRAFSARGMYAKILIEKEIIQIKRCRKILNEYLLSKCCNYDNRVYFAYPEGMVVKINGTLFEIEIANEYLNHPDDEYCEKDITLRTVDNTPLSK